MVCVEVQHVTHTALPVIPLLVIPCDLQCIYACVQCAWGLMYMPTHTQVLERRIVEAGMDLEAYSAYLDLRRYGTVPHAGFGLGFERLVMFATGMTNIRDVIPFPRWPGHANS